MFWVKVSEVRFGEMYFEAKICGVRFERVCFGIRFWRERFSG